MHELQQAECVSPKEGSQQPDPSSELQHCVHCRMRSQPTGPSDLHAGSPTSQVAGRKMPAWQVVFPEMRKPL